MAQADNILRSHLMEADEILSTFNRGDSTSPKDNPCNNTLLMQMKRTQQTGDQGAYNAAYLTFFTRWEKRLTRDLLRDTFFDGSKFDASERDRIIDDTISYIVHNTHKYDGEKGAKTDGCGWIRKAFEWRKIDAIRRRNAKKRGGGQSVGSIDNKKGEPRDPVDVADRATNKVIGADLMQCIQENLPQGDLQILRQGIQKSKKKREEYNEAYKRYIIALRACASTLALSAEG